MVKHTSYIKVVILGRFFKIFLFFTILSSYNFAQPSCDLSTSSFPPTPFVNAFLKFDGKGDYLKTNDINELEFDTASTAEFEIETSFKLNKEYSPQYIIGKYYSKGWIIGYHTSEYGYVSITFSGGWKNIYYLGADTSWHKYKVTYDKQSKVLRTFVDGVLTFTYTDFSYGNIENNSAFSVGNVGFFPNYGPQSINVVGNWFKGSVDFIKVSVNQANVVNYDFNECAGQFAKDSLSFFINDRTLPGEQSCGAVHLMLGFYPCEDTCDPEWVRDDIERETDFYMMGEGLKSVVNNNGYEMTMQSFSTGMTNWNGYLVACGKFNRAGSEHVNNIAKWNGTSWSSVGNGFNYELNDVKEYGGDLYATGYFDSAVGFGAANYIAKWDGTAWQPMGIGLGSIGNVMEVYNNELIVGGFFISAGETYSPRIARWNGSEWNSMGFGMSGPVYALCVYNGELYAGGNFIYAGENSCNGIAKWNGSQWLPVGTGVVGGEKVIRTLKVYNGELYAGGSFIYMNGVYCSNVAKWNGSQWSSLDDGAKGYNCTSSLGYIFSLETAGNDLYAAGLFTKIGTISANKIAKWNGNDWCTVEYGIDLLPRSLESFGGSLYISGDFYSVSGKNYSNIVKYNPKTLTGVTNNNNIPAKMELKQNYPNPFNPVTKIDFSINKPGEVKLIVYDIQGRETNVLVNGYQNAGNHSVSFNAGHLCSGVYFYTLVSEGKILDTKKMLLVK
jgi:hypothetical protein